MEEEANPLLQQPPTVAAFCFEEPMKVLVFARIWELHICWPQPKE